MSAVLLKEKTRALHAAVAQEQGHNHVSVGFDGLEDTLAAKRAARTPEERDDDLANKPYQGHGRTRGGQLWAVFTSFCFQMAKGMWERQPQSV